MTAETLTPYGEIADVLGRLPLLVASERRSRRLALRPAAIEIGIGHTTLARLERGENSRVDVATKVLRWLDHGLPV